MKLCKDCKHFIEVVPNVSANCARTGYIEPVFGAKWYQTCDWERSNERETCGPDGMKWEPKEEQ